jgi:DNA-binding NarL/FixJ family response regulator
MAVLSQPATGIRKPSDELCIAVCADDPVETRVAAALEASYLEAKLLHFTTPGGLALAEIDAGAIVVLGCDPDIPDQMAALRRASRDLRQQAIVIISPVATGSGVRRALDAGADAIVFEPELESTLVVAISAVASGQSVVPRELRASVERPAFSHRERQVLEYVAKGLTNAQIAERLFLSESTIKSHLSSAFAKFGVRSRKEAAALFLELQAATNGVPSDPEYVLTEPSPRGANT